MARWGKAAGWGVLLWTAGLLVVAALAGLDAGCGEVKPADLHLCELDRDSTISGLVVVWFLGVLPLGLGWSFARLQRPRCRVCGDELAAADHRICRRCGARLIETAARGH